MGFITPSSNHIQRGGTLRVKHFALRGFKFSLLPNGVHAHTQVTHTVGWLWQVRNLVYFYLTKRVLRNKS